MGSNSHYARRELSPMGDSWWRWGIRMPETPPLRHHITIDADEDPFSPDDFRDVFGGPPRTVLTRHLPAACPRSSTSRGFFCEDVFRPPANSPTVGSSHGRSLPKFKIPAKTENDDFYDDIFGWENENSMRTRARSKGGISSGDLSSLRPSGFYDDDKVSRFASNLRPINVKSQQTSIGKQSTPTPGDDMRNNPFGFSQKNASPETISLEPMSNCSILRVSADDLEVNSPSSPISPIEKVQELYEEEDAEDIMSSYVIEVNTADYYRTGTSSEPNGVDEAIAWAKEKFQTTSPEENKPNKDLSSSQKNQGSVRHSESVGSSDKEEQGAAEEQTAENEILGQREMRLLDKKIRQWSAGKENDIRLLLSTLHHILWPNSGWLAIPLPNLIEIAKLKKAYQRARLCLHPDKLQQKGATPPQRYLAEKAFSILQDAWEAFISTAIL